MNENARQRQNPRVKGSFGGSTKPSVQGPKQCGARNCWEVRSPQNERGYPRRREPTQALEFTPADYLMPSTSQTTPWWEEKPPPKWIPSHSPRHEETQTLPRGAGRGQGGAPCQGAPRPPQPSPGMGQTHIPFREPHTRMRRGSSLSAEGSHRPSRSSEPPAKRGDRSSHILPTYVAGGEGWSHSPSP